MGRAVERWLIDPLTDMPSEFMTSELDERARAHQREPARAESRCAAARWGLSTAALGFFRTYVAWVRT